MPNSGLDQNGFSWVQDSRVPIRIDVENAVKNLKGFFFSRIVMRRMTLPGQLDDQFLAIFPIDTLNDHSASFTKILQSIMMRILNFKLTSQLNFGFVLKKDTAPISQPCLTSIRTGRI